jgi:hypothetical protein
MPSYEVGYKKPPLHTQFKAGNPGNRRRRGKQEAPTEAGIVQRLLNCPVEFRVGGKSKRAPRIELLIKRFGALALKGDIGAAAMLLKMRAHFEKNGDVNPEVITIKISEDDANL